MNDPLNPNKLNDWSVNGDPVNEIDYLASRLVDGEIASDEVPESLQIAVQARASQFNRHRQTMLNFAFPVVETPITQALAAHRRQRMRRTSRSAGLVAAAASFLVLSGLVIAQFGNSDDSTDIMSASSDTALAITAEESAAQSSQDSQLSQKSESVVDGSGLSTYGVEESLNDDEFSTAAESGEIFDIQSVEELEQLSNTWPIEELARESAQENSSSVCITASDHRLITRRARFKGVPAEIYQVSTGTSMTAIGLIVYAQDDCRLLARLDP
jgi:hypothetical protein